VSLPNPNTTLAMRKLIQASRLLGVQFLREATPQLVEETRLQMSSTIYRRARHVVTENQRVHAFSNAMRNNDLLLMGQLINASHASLRDDYEVSSPELNLIVELAQKQPECLGARMMGAGFGGCALALLRTDNRHARSRKRYSILIMNKRVLNHTSSR
jgi:galactokinase